MGWSFGAYETWAVVRLMGLEGIRGIFNIDMPPRALVDDESTEWHETTLEAFKDTMQSIRSQEDFLLSIDASAEILYTGDYNEDDVRFLRDNSRNSRALRSPRTSAPKRSWPTLASPATPNS